MSVTSACPSQRGSTDSTSGQYKTLQDSTRHIINVNYIEININQISLVLRCTLVNLCM